MPPKTYKVTDPSTGRTIKMTGEQPPNEEQIKQAFASLPPKPSGPDTTGIEQSSGDASQIGGLIETGKGIIGSIPNQVLNIGSFLDRTFGANTPESQAGYEKAKEAWKPQNPAQQLGGYIGDVVTAAVPGSAVTSTGKALAAAAPRFTKLATRAATEAAGGAGIAIAQGGDPTTGAVLGGTVGTVMGAGRGARGAMQNPNAVEREALEYVAANKVPVDAGTMSGNRLVKAVQYGADRSIPGSFVATKAAGQEAQALTDLGGDLASRAHPTAVTAEQAGEGITGGLTQNIADQRVAQRQAYGDLESIGQQHVRPVPVGAAQTVESLHARFPAAPSVIDGRTVRAGVPNEGSIASSLDSYEELPGIRTVKMSDFDPEYSVKPYSASESSRLDALERQIGESKEISPLIVVVDSEQYPYILEGGHRFDALKRMGAKEFPAKVVVDTSGPLSRATELMAMPADVTAAKAALRPIRDAVRRQMPVTQQAANPGLKALDNIIDGPDVVPAATLDADLGAIKSLARADNPNLRTVSQGLASRAVKELSDAVDAAISVGGQPARDALAAGREATRLKYATAKVLKSTSKEPVKAFNKATAREDTNIGFLRELQRETPRELPKVGRAVLDDMLGRATADGGFKNGGTLANEWQNLGPETKRMLYGQALTDELDKFWLAVRKISENPNPSGTAGVMLGNLSGGGLGIYLSLLDPSTFIASQVSGGVTSKLLRNPTAVKWLTQGLNAPKGSMTRRAVTRSLASLVKQYGMREATGSSNEIYATMGEEKDK